MTLFRKILISLVLYLSVPTLFVIFTDIEKLNPLSDVLWFYLTWPMSMVLALYYIVVSFGG